MRDGERLHADIPQPEALPGLHGPDQVPRNLSELSFHRPPGFLGGVQRKVILPGDYPGALDMVGMLVRDQHAAEAFRLHMDFLQRRRQAAAGFPGVDQQPRAAVLAEQRVSA